MSAFVLKIIATITMIIDHFGVIFSDVMNTNNLRLIGRISFPIFAFLTAQSCRHTSNIKKYFLRLFISACLIEAGGYLSLILINGKTPLSGENLNIFFTLSVAVIIIMVHKLIVPKLFFPLPFLMTILLVYLSSYINLDYGIYGICLILVFYFVRQKSIAIPIATILIMIYYNEYIYSFIKYRVPYDILLPLFTLIPLIFIGLYNGKKGKNVNKYIFYIIYPGHLMLIYGIHYLIYGN